MAKLTHTLTATRVNQIAHLVAQCYAYVDGKLKEKPVDPLGRFNVDELIGTARASRRLTDRAEYQVSEWLKNRRKVI